MTEICIAKMYGGPLDGYDRRTDMMLSEGEQIPPMSFRFVVCGIAAVYLLDAERMTFPIDGPEEFIYQYQAATS